MIVATTPTPAATIPIDVIITIIVFAVVISGLFYYCAMHPYKPPREYWFYSDDRDENDGKEELPNVFEDLDD